jgi:hypothetical protein
MTAIVMGAWMLGPAQLQSLEVLLGVYFVRSLFFESAERGFQLSLESVDLRRLALCGEAVLLAFRFDLLESGQDARFFAISFLDSLLLFAGSGVDKRLGIAE